MEEKRVEISKKINMFWNRHKVVIFHLKYNQNWEQGQFYGYRNQFFRDGATLLSVSYYKTMQFRAKSMTKIKINARVIQRQPWLLLFLKSCSILPYHMLHCELNTGSEGRRQRRYRLTLLLMWIKYRLWNTATTKI